MPGTVESAIRANLRAGDALETIGRSAGAVIGTFDSSGAVLLVGHRQARAPMTWGCLEGIPLFLVGRDWVPLSGSEEQGGGSAGTGAGAGSLATFLESRDCGATAPHVAALLEAAGVVEVDRDRPPRVRLVRAMSPARSSRPAVDKGGAAITSGTRTMEERPARHYPGR